MITPKHAREISNDSIGEEDYYMKDATEMIQWAAKNGRCEVYLCTTSETAKKLRRIGYKVIGFLGTYHVRW